MKKITFFAIALLAIILSSCSNIAEDERLIYVAPAEVGSAVLIEDFTGQRCVNCPNATEKIHELQELYGEDAVIPVAIHCGPFGFTGNKKYEGLKKDATQAYWDAFFDDSQGQPVAKFNRGAANDDYQNWSSVVAQEVQKTTNVSLNAECSYNESTRTASATVTTLGPIGEKVHLQLWLLEDNIEAMQLLPDGSVMTQYVHNHVLREVINGTWGDELTFTDGAFSKNYDFTISENYKPENCSLVVFVYDETNGVRQVIKKKLTE